MYKQGQSKEIQGANLRSARATKTKANTHKTTGFLSQSYGLGLLFSRPCVARGGFYYSLGRLLDSVGFGPGRSAGKAWRRTKFSRFSGEIRFSSWRAPFELRKALPYVSKRAASFEHSVVRAIWTADRVLPELRVAACQGCLRDALMAPRVA